MIGTCVGFVGRFSSVILSMVVNCVLRKKGAGRKNAIQDFNIGKERYENHAGEVKNCKEAGRE